MPNTVTKELADKLTAIAVKQLEVGVKDKQKRLKDIQKNEDLYNGKNDRPALKGRFNVPLPIMSGFVDTLMAKIDDPPRIKFNNTKAGGLKLAQKVGAAWEVDSSSIRGKWAKKDRAAKKLAAFSGRAIYKYFAESDPKYRSVLEVVDYNDFYCEPRGGGDLADHLFKGQANIWRTKKQLFRGVKSGLYDAAQLTQLMSKASGEAAAKSQELFKNKMARRAALGLDTDNDPYINQDVFSMVEHVMNYEGEDYYLFFEITTGTWMRVETVKEVFGTELEPFVSWATHEDAFNFWSKAPCDDMRPIVEAMTIIFNQALDNRHQRNRPQRAFDPTIFTDPSQLEWRPDGLVIAQPPEGKSISSGIYTFDTPEINGSIDLFQLLDNFSGQKTGITPSTQGTADKDVRVGVYFGDLQQVADRLGLLNKSYSECWAELGIRYYHGLREHMPEKLLVRMLGESGVEWNELLRSEVSGTDEEDFDITIAGGDAELQANEVAMKRRTETLDAILKDQKLSGLLSPSWSLQEMLRNGGYSEESIRQAMDTKNEGNQEILSEASSAIEQILEGKDPGHNRGATTAFVQKILDFATDNELETDVYRKLMAYAKDHIPVAKENAARKAAGVLAAAGAGPGIDAADPGAAAPGGGPIPPAVIPGMPPNGGAPPANPAGTPQL